jgi:fused signal recognition particle receptor
VDRLQRTLALARQNKAEREDRRRQFAQEQYMRQWRSGCDDLRTLDSEAYARFTKEEQDKQRGQRAALNAEERAEEARWLDVWEQDRQRKLQREQEEAARRAVAAVEMRDAIAKQMASRADQRQRVLEDKAAERAEWLARVQAETAAAEQAKRELAERKSAQGRAVAQWNDEWLEQRREAKRRQMEADRAELEQHLHDYQIELARKHMDQRAMQQEMVAYREYLTLRKAEERRQEEELDRITRDYQDVTNARQDAEWARDAAARRALQSDATAAQRAQMAAHEQARLDARAGNAETRTAVELAAQREKELERAEDAARSAQSLQWKMDLETQMRQRANVRALEQARIKQEEEAAAVAEAQYREFVRLEQGRARLAGASRVVAEPAYGRRATDWNARI